MYEKVGEGRQGRLVEGGRRLGHRQRGLSGEQPMYVCHLRFLLRFAPTPRVPTGVGGLNGRRDTMSLPLAFRYPSRSHSSWMVAPGTGNPARASADAVVCVPRTKRKGVLVALPQLVSSTWCRWDVPPHRSAARCRAANTDAVVAVAGVPPAAILRQERHRGGTRS